jgi:hypothetical protein
MVRAVKLASIKMGDVDDVGVYAGFAIHEWQQSDVAQKLKKLNIEPQMWKVVPTYIHMVSLLIFGVKNMTPKIWPWQDSQVYWINLLEPRLNQFIHFAIKCLLYHCHWRYISV